MRRVRAMCLVAVVCAVNWVLISGALAQEDVSAETRWHQPTVTILDVDFGDTGFHARWEYFHCDCGDVLMRFEQSSPEGVTTGEMLLVDGQVLAGRGPVAETADLESQLQAPLLMLHLAFGLLERGLPEGPASVGKRRQKIEYREAFNNFQLNSGQFTGDFGAPWDVDGAAWAGAEGRRRFDMNFSFTIREPGVEPMTDTIALSGGQDYRPGAFPLHEQASLAGWQVQWISKNEPKSSPAADGLTVAGLREQAKLIDAPAEAASNP